MNTNNKFLRTSHLCFHFLKKKFLYLRPTYFITYFVVVSPKLPITWRRSKGMVHIQTEGMYPLRSSSFCEQMDIDTINYTSRVKLTSNHNTRR